MAYQVVMMGRVSKGLRKLPENVLRKFEALAITLREHGPTGPHAWQNYSKLGENEYHCHLTHHYAACWRHEKGTIIIEVYYVGSREGAPY